MEYVAGLKLRNIFLHNGNWWKLFITHPHLIRKSIIVNVLKLLVCRTSFLGFHYFICPKCNKSFKAPHSCKSRFCPSCGKKATDNWIKTKFNTLPKTTYQHITFTMPDKLWPIVALNHKNILNKLPSLAANIIKDISKQKGFLPGIFLAIHTFGRDLKYNSHIHLSTTIGGLSLFNHSSWIKSCYFHHQTLKDIWKYKVVSLLQNEFKNGNLKLPKHLNHIKSYTTFCSWMSHIYNKNWNVWLDKQSSDLKKNIDYLGKYLKRPPIGETRILSYDGKSVTYKYLDHYTKSYSTSTLPVLDFIALLIIHIPHKNFRNIRYYGFLANRVSTKLLPIVYKLLDMKNIISKKVSTSWRNMLKNTFSLDPLICPVCNNIMRLAYIRLPQKTSLLSMHKEIAHGHFPLL